MLQLKRTFIPPSHRPYVRGSQLTGNEITQNEISKRIENDFERRKLIMEILQGNSPFLDLDQKWMKDVLISFFPQLSEISPVEKDGNANV